MWFQYRHVDQDEDMTSQADDTGTGPGKMLSPAARRALAEAEARRAEAARSQRQAPNEIGGRGGTDPARYGDWEVKGIASDF
jgi:hypothetical protein